MEHYLTFKKMITPIIIQILFWFLVVAVIIAGLVTIANRQVVAGLAMIILGPILLRMYAEILLVIFMINDTLTDLSDTVRRIEANTRRPEA